MKTLQLQTEKATIILVDLPDNSKNYEIIYTIPFSEEALSYDVGDKTGFGFKIFPRGDWQILGLLDSLSEEQKGRVIKNVGVWFDLFPSFSDVEDEYFDTISESFQSLLESYNVTRVNPIASSKPTKSDTYNELFGEATNYERYISLLNSWLCYEALTFNNPLVLFCGK